MSQNANKQSKQDLYVIKQSFLESKNHKFMAQNAQKLNSSYQSFAETIQAYYRALGKLCQSKHELQDQKVQFLNVFIKYLAQNQKILQRLTQYQLSCFEMSKENNQEQSSLEAALHQILQKIKEYAPEQMKVREKSAQLTEQFTAIRNQYSLLSKKMKKAKYFYDNKYMQKLFSPLSAKIKLNQKNQNAILKELNKISQNTSIFSNDVDYFRKSLLKNKYRYHRRFLDLAINSKESLKQIFYFLMNCFNKWSKQIKRAMQTQDDQFSLLKSSKKFQSIVGDPSDCISVLIKNSDQFTNLILKVEQNLRLTQKNFEGVERTLHHIQKSGMSKNALNQVNRFFEHNQSPGPMILETIHAFQFCLKRISKNSLACKNSVESLEAIRKNICRQKGVTLSLLKVKADSGLAQTVKVIKSSTRMQDECGFYQLMNTLDLTNVKTVVGATLDCMSQTLHEIRIFFNQRNGIQRKFGTSDSMQLSYFQMSILEVKKKKPVKEQLWLWGNFRKKMSTEFSLSVQLFKEITAHAQKFSQQIQAGLQIEKYACFSENIDETGFLTLSKKCLRFTSYISERQLSIPISEVQEIVRKKKAIIKDTIYITTKLGQLSFKQFKDSEQVENTIREILESGGTGGATVNIKKIEKIQLTENELLQLQSRKKQIEKDLINIQGFELQAEKTFPSWNMFEMYNLVLSDKQYTMTGKQHQNFMACVVKKMQNKNLKVTKYDPPGPKFYTQLDDGPSFKESPLVSQIKFDYTHILPKIPFMPSQVQNSESRKIYWVSEKELDYLIRAQTSGVPMSDCFYIEVLYRFSEQDQNVLAKVYGRIKWTKSASLQSMVEKNMWPQLKLGCQKTLQQMEKGVNLYKQLLSGKAVEQEEDDTTQVQGQSQVEKLRKRNNYLLIGIGAIILLNILFKILF